MATIKINAADKLDEKLEIVKNAKTGKTDSISYGSEFSISKYMDIDEIIVPSPSEFSNRFVDFEEMKEFCSSSSTSVGSSSSPPFEDDDDDEIDYQDVEQFDENYDDGDCFMYEEGLYHGY